jgi:dsRNA-specific ribonuclease
MELNKDELNKAITQDGDIFGEAADMVFDPYNPNNIEITLNQVNSILEAYGLPSKVHNINLYHRAFVHKSYVKRAHLENVENGVIIVDKPNNCMKLKTKSNERLEFLGDGI